MMYDEIDMKGMHTHGYVAGFITGVLSTLGLEVFLMFLFMYEKGLIL